MNIGKIITLLSEYNSSKTNTTLAAPGGKKASGKNYDNMIIGASQPYKNKKYETEYGKKFPNIQKAVDKIKNQGLPGDMLLSGLALKEFKKLLQKYNPRQREDGTYSLPFGDNVRIKKRGNNFFVTVVNKDALKSATTDINNITQPVN